MEWTDLPPGSAIGQASTAGGAKCRALVMGMAGRCKRAGTQLQHFTANRASAAARAVTGLTGHDIVIPP
jgi:hypothetical protein